MVIFMTIVYFFINKRRNYKLIDREKEYKKIERRIFKMECKIESIDDETENYVGVEDEEIVEKVYTIFKKNHADEFDFTD